MHFVQFRPSENRQRVRRRLPRVRLQALPAALVRPENARTALLRAAFVGLLFASSRELSAGRAANVVPASPPVPVSVPTPTESVAVPAAGATVTTVLGEGYAASIALPASSAAVTVALTASPQPPQGIAAVIGRPILYATIVPAASTTFIAGGVIGGTLSSRSPLEPDGTYQIALYAPPVGWLMSPSAAVVAGRTLTFTYALPVDVPVLAMPYTIAITRTQ